MADLLVKLYDLNYNFSPDLSEKGVAVKKACIIDKNIILDFIKTNFPEDPSWPHECEFALFNNPPSCHIAVKNKEIIGFSCYDATAKGFFGPMGVKKDFRKMGVGRGLLIRSLYSMKENGYAYAIIGWPAKNAVEFYKKNVGAIEIKDSPPGKSIYKNSAFQE